MRDEERFVAASLRAVLAQDLGDGALEVLVVDGGSRDRTCEIVRELAEDARFPVRLIDNPGRIAATGLNRGIDAAAADVVVRVDGHAEIPPGYVRRLLRVLATTDAVAAGGTVRATVAGPRGEGIQCALRSRLGTGGAAFRTLRSGVERAADTVGFPAYRKAAVQAVGGFDEEMVRNQDDDLHLRLREAGGRLILVPDLVVTYRCRDRLRRLARQYFGYGFWKVVGARKRGRLTTRRALFPAALAAWVALSAAAAVAVPVVLGAQRGIDGGERVAGALVLFALLFLLLNLLWLNVLHWASLFVTPPPRSWRARLLGTPEIALAVMYVAYGFGFWWGVARRGRPPRRTP